MFMMLGVAEPQIITFVSLMSDCCLKRTALNFSKHHITFDLEKSKTLYFFWRPRHSIFLLVAISSAFHFDSRRPRSHRQAASKEAGKPDAAAQGHGASLDRRTHVQKMKC